MEDHESNPSHSGRKNLDNSERLARVKREFQLLIADPGIPEEIRDALLEGYLAEANLK